MLLRDRLLPRDCWAICAPDGPGTPFSPETFLVDCFRIVVMVLGIVLIVWTPRLVIHAKALGQQCRLLGQMCCALIVVGSEVDHIGDYSHYRLYVSFLAVTLMLYGMYRMRYERPPVTRNEHRVRDE